MLVILPRRGTDAAVRKDDGIRKIEVCPVRDINRKFDESGQPRISKLVFPSETGGPLEGSNAYNRDFLPCLDATGIRRVTFHALRHTFASLLIQQGASLAYYEGATGPQFDLGHGGYLWPPDSWRQYRLGRRPPKTKTNDTAGNPSAARFGPRESRRKKPDATPREVLLQEDYGLEPRR